MAFVVTCKMMAPKFLFLSRYALSNYPLHISTWFILGISRTELNLLKWVSFPCIPYISREFHLSTNTQLVGLSKSP